MKKIIPFLTFALLTCIFGCTEPQQIIPEPQQIIPYDYYEPCETSQVGNIKKFFIPSYNAQNPPGELYEYICVDLKSSKRRLSLIEQYKNDGYDNPVFEHDYYYDSPYTMIYCHNGINDTNDDCEKVHPMEYTECTSTENKNICIDNISFNCFEEKTKFTEASYSKILTYHADCSESGEFCIDGYCQSKKYDWQYETCDDTFSPHCIDNVLVECIDGRTDYLSNITLHPNAKCMTIADQSKTIIPCDESEIDGQPHQDCIQLQARSSLLYFRYNYFCRNFDVFGPHQVFDSDNPEMSLCDVPCGQPCPEE